MQTAEFISLLGPGATSKRKIRTILDLVDIGRAGIPKKSLTYFSKSNNIAMTLLAELLQINKRTIERKSASEKMNQNVSERLILLAKVFAHGNDVFGSNERFKAWLNAECLALGDEKPIDLLKTAIGFDMVEEELIRIEHGVLV